MDYGSIRNAIVKGLHNNFNIDVVPTDDTNKKPNYPYISYKFITLRIPQGSYNLYTEQIPSTNPDFEYDIEYTREEQPKMVISVSTYSTNEIEAYQLALEAEAWFEFKGYMYLKENGIIVTNITNIQDRTSLIVDSYERRQGFDVTIRVKDVQKIRVETIEKVNTEGEINE